MISLNGHIASFLPWATKPLPNPAERALKFLPTLSQLPADRLHPWCLHKGQGGAAPLVALSCLSHSPHGGTCTIPSAGQICSTRLINAAQLQVSHPNSDCAPPGSSAHEPSCSSFPLPWSSLQGFCLPNKPRVKKPTHLLPFPPAQNKPRSHSDSAWLQQNPASSW